MPLSETEKKFVNPKHLEFDGSFTVEVTSELPSEKRGPASVRREGNILHVTDGRVCQSMGAIQMYGRPNRQSPFYIGYHYLVCIRNTAGTPLLINHDHR